MGGGGLQRPLYPYKAAHHVCSTVSISVASVAIEPILVGCAACSVYYVPNHSYLETLDVCDLCSQTQCSEFNVADQSLTGHNLLFRHSQDRLSMWYRMLLCHALTDIEHHYDML